MAAVVELERWLGAVEREGRERLRQARRLRQGVRRARACSGSRAGHQRGFTASKRSARSQR